MSDATYWIKAAKLDQGTLGTVLALDNSGKKQPIIFVGILTVNRLAQQGLASEDAGQRLQLKIGLLDGYRVVVKVRKTIANRSSDIESTLREWSDSLNLNLIITTGGTGCAPTDITPEATRSVIDKETPGFVSAMLSASLKLNPTAMLFRGICGIRKRVFILNLPDGVQASCDFLDVLMPALPLAISQLKANNPGPLFTDSISVKTTSRSSPGIPAVPISLPSPTASQSHVSTHHTALPVFTTGHHISASAGSHHALPVATSEYSAQPVAAHTAHHSANLNLTTDHSAHTVADHGHHVVSGQTGLLTEDDIDLSSNLEEDEPPPQSSIAESLRIVGGKPFSPAIEEDSVVSGYGSFERVDTPNRKRISPYPAVTVDKAFSTIFAHSTPLPLTTKSFTEAAGFVAAEDVCAVDRVPSVPTSILDGYAVIAVDMPGDVEVIGSSSSSSKDTNKLPYLTLGKAVRVTTGAPMPLGADAVIAVEETTLLATSEDGKRELKVRCSEASTPGQYIRKVGSDIAAGEVVVQAGDRLDHVSLGVLPSVGVTSVRVHRHPVVAVLSIGTELTEPDQAEIGNGQTRDTNRITLLTAIREAGYPVVDMGITSDSAAECKNVICSAYEQADVVVTTGGCSIGENDSVKSLVNDIGATLRFGRVQMKPGAPSAFATLETQRGKKLFFHLPGVPLPALVAYHVLVLPCLRKLSGAREPRSSIISTRLSTDAYLSRNPEYQRATLRWERGEPIPLADVTGRQTISRFSSMIGANALILLPKSSDERSVIKRGEIVDALIIKQI